MSDRLILRLVGHRCPETREEELAEVRGELEAARSLMQSAGKQRDWAHRLLRAVRILFTLPPSLERDINCAVALESEGDIENARTEAQLMLERMGIPTRGDS